MVEEVYGPTPDLSDVGVSPHSLKGNGSHQVLSRLWSARDRRSIDRGHFASLEGLQSTICLAPPALHSIGSLQPQGPDQPVGHREPARLSQSWQHPS